MQLRACASVSARGEMKVHERMNEGMTQFGQWCCGEGMLKHSNARTVSPSPQGAPSHAVSARAPPSLFHSRPRTRHSSSGISVHTHRAAV